MTNDLLLLRCFIREEISRDFKTGRLDQYPWDTAGNHITIYLDPADERFIVNVADSEFNTIEQSKKNSEEEARHWARTIVDDLRREEFSQEDK